MNNPTKSEVKDLEKTWNESLLDEPGVICTSQTPAPICMASCDRAILYAWSPMPVLREKQKTV